MPEKHLTIADIEARAEALEECAEHMGQNWTDDERERKAGNALAVKLRREADRWRTCVAMLRRLRIDDATIADADF